jgi:hypothetical protein
MLKRTAQAEGLSGLYKGLLVSLAEIGPYLAISLGGYEFLKARVIESKEGGVTNAERVWLSLGCGWFSGLCASLVCYPLDTVKRQLMLDGAWVPQSAPPVSGTVDAKAAGEIWSRRHQGRVRDCMRSLLNDGAKKGRPLAPFYNGCMINALKSSPAAAITFFTNDALKRFLGYGD